MVYSVRPNFISLAEIFHWYFALIVICNRLTIIIFVNGEMLSSCIHRGRCEGGCPQACDKVAIFIC